VGAKPADRDGKRCNIDTYFEVSMGLDGGKSEKDAR